MKRIVICVLLASGGWGNQPQVSRKPVCKAAVRGKFWPEAANSDPKLARRLAQCGALEVCTCSPWRHRWQPVAVNVRQMGKAPLEPTPACAAVMAEFAEPER